MHSRWYTPRSEQDSALPQHRRSSVLVDFCLEGWCASGRRRSRRPSKQGGANTSSLPAVPTRPGYPTQPTKQNQTKDNGGVQHCPAADALLTTAARRPSALYFQVCSRRWILMVTSAAPLLSPPPPFRCPGCTSCSVHGVCEGHEQQLLLRAVWTHHHCLGHEAHDCGSCA